MSHDTVIHRIVRAPVRVIARTGATPNHVTTIRLLTGLGAAACFAAGPHRFAIGALVMLVSLLLDRADGELARQTGQMSLAGYRYDLISDCIASVAVFVGLGIGLDRPWPGVIAGVGIGVLFAELNIVHLASVRGYRLAPGVTVDPDDAMVLVPVLIWCGLAAPMLTVAAVVTPLAAIGVAVAGLAARRRGVG
jgi:phosphatidylglycerophosphate synthase